MPGRDYKNINIGEDFQAEQDSLLRLLHAHKIDLITIGLGFAFILLWSAFVFYNIHIDSRRENGLAAILALGCACCSIGLTGAMTVEFKKSGLIAKGAAGFAVFILVLVFTTR
jgi:hypothetical protein